MCRMASDPDTTYVPYAMSNREATSQISNIMSLHYIQKIVDLGTVTAGTSVQKTIAECTDNILTTPDRIRALTLLRGFGYNKDDVQMQVKIFGNNFIFYPTASQQTTRAQIGILYE